MLLWMVFALPAAGAAITVVYLNRWQEWRRWIPLAISLCAGLAVPLVLTVNVIFLRREAELVQGLKDGSVSRIRGEELTAWQDGLTNLASMNQQVAFLVTGCVILLVLGMAYYLFCRLEASVTQATASDPTPSPTPLSEVLAD